MFSWKRAQRVIAGAVMLLRIRCKKGVKTPPPGDAAKPPLVAPLWVVGGVGGRLLQVGRAPVFWDWSPLAARGSHPRSPQLKQNMLSVRWGPRQHQAIGSWQTLP